MGTMTMLGRALVIVSSILTVPTTHVNGQHSIPQAAWMSGKHGIGFRIPGGVNMETAIYDVELLASQIRDEIPEVTWVLLGLSSGAYGDQYLSPHSVLTDLNRGSTPRMTQGHATLPDWFNINTGGTVDFPLEEYPHRDLFSEVATAFKNAGFKVIAYMAAQGPAMLKAGEKWAYDYDSKSNYVDSISLCEELSDGNITNGGCAPSVWKWKQLVKSKYGSDDDATLHHAYAEIIIKEYANKFNGVNGPMIDGWWFDQGGYMNIELVHDIIHNENPLATIAFNKGQKAPLINNNPPWEDFTFGYPNPVGGGNPTPPYDDKNLPMITSVENTDDNNKGFFVDTTSGKHSLGHCFIMSNSAWNNGQLVWDDEHFEKAVDWMSRVIENCGAWTWNIKRSFYPTKLHTDDIKFLKRVYERLPAYNASCDIVTTHYPSISPSTLEPTYTNLPSVPPSLFPSTSILPTELPSVSPSTLPSLSTGPTQSPSLSSFPSTSPSLSSFPSASPSLSSFPSTSPSDLPTLSPSVYPTLSILPSTSPSDLPTLSPTVYPTLSILPSAMPSYSECISMIDQYEDCIPWDEAFNHTTYAANETVTIPCEVCVSMGNFTDGEVLNLTGGLDVVGILIFPEGTKVTIITPFVFVQGKLMMRAQHEITNKPSIKIELVGTKDNIFMPHGRNQKYGVMNVGKKAFFIAGGHLDIKGFPEDCPSWSNMEYYNITNLPPAEPTWFPTYPGVPTECMVDVKNNTLLSIHFVNSLDGWTSSPGTNIKLIAGINEEFSFARVTGRSDPSQGPTLILPSSLHTCLIPGEEYLFSTKLRLNTVGGGNSSCHYNGIHCPVIKLSVTTTFIRSFEAPTDGEWFFVRGKFWIDGGWLGPKNKITLTINGVEEGVDIDMEHFEVTIPNQGGFPDPGLVCKNLVTNGFANMVEGFPFPQNSYMKDTELKVKYDDNDDPYFHLTDRKQFYSSLTFDINPGCVPDKSKYYMSTMIWIHSDQPVVGMVVMKTHHPKESPEEFHFDIIKRCPPSSKEIGWILCKQEFTFDERHEVAPKIDFLVLTQGDDASDVSYKELTFLFDNVVTDARAMFPKAVYECWGKDAEMLVTPQTFNFNDEQILTIANVTEDGVVRFNELDYIRPLSLDESIFPGEYALLSRNIVFEAIKDDSSLDQGGYLNIYKTDGYEYPQIIDGVEFWNFGQQGKKNRYPIGFQKSSNHGMSFISNNAIRESNQRCINIEGTSKLLIKGNVAYQTVGHCYVMEGRSSRYNVIKQNIGSYTTNMVGANLGSSDDQAATFFFENTDVEVLGNVAAGSEHVGMWFALKQDVKTSITKFLDNTVHSNAFMGISTFPKGFNSNKLTVFENSRVYRNRGVGIYFHYGQRFKVIGGVVADNRIGIDINYCSGVIIKDVSVVGYSDEYRNLAEFHKLPRFCNVESEAIYGIRIHANNKDTTMEGSELRNITFGLFDDNTGCLGNKAIYMNHLTYYNLTVDTKYSFEEIHMFVSPENTLGFCDVSDIGIGNDIIDDLYIADDGSLNPDGDISGFIVNDHPNMTAWAETCIELDGCVQYCTGPGSCMSKVTIGVNPQMTEDVKLVVQNENDDVMITVHGVLTIADVGITDNLQFDSRRYYWFYLPSGDYTGYFEVNGTGTWPSFTEIMIDNPYKPNCMDHDFNFKVLEPNVNCDSLLHEDFELGEVGSNGWLYNLGGMKLVDGYAGGMALSTDGRSSHIYGLGYHLDTRCMVLGMQYEIHAKVKLSNNAVCNPGVLRVGSDRCPRANIFSYWNGRLTEFEIEVGDTEEKPWVAGKFNDLFGMFHLTAEMALADRVALLFDGPNSGNDLIIDDVSISTFIVTCDNLIWNGNFAEETEYWDSNGGMILLDNGLHYNGTGHSLSTVTRKTKYRSMTQDLNSLDCLKEGQIYEVDVDYRLEDYYGYNEDCNPFNKYTTWSTCPQPGFKFAKLKKRETFIYIGLPIGPYHPGEWNKLNGFFTVTSDVINADAIQFFLGKTASGKNIVIDNVSIKLANNNTYGLYKNCSQLVTNGDAEIGDARYWYIKGSGDFGTLSIVPGEHNSSLAFHHSGDRNKDFHGMWQDIDQDCMETGSAWKVTADFKLFSKTGIEIGCDKLAWFGPKVCPMFFFQSITGTGRPYSTGALRTESPGDWVIGEWNPYEAIFIMNSSHKAKESTSFFIHNVPPGYSYSVDNISITRTEKPIVTCGNIVYNGNFEQNHAKYWHYNGNNVGLDLVDNKLKYNETGYSLSTVSRAQRWDSMSQDLLTQTCLIKGQIYEVYLDYRLEDIDGSDVSCDAFNKYTVEASCPQPAFKLIDSSKRETFKYIGRPIGPYKIGQWNKLRGHFTVTEDITTASSLEFQLAKAGKGKNIVVDNIVVKLADYNTYGLDSNCSQLVINGDAEIGDARNWYIKGNGNHGTISMIPGEGNSSLAFYHGGDRTRDFNGMWQDIDQDCMVLGSSWKVTADFKLFNKTLEEVGCDKTSLIGTDVCPMFFFQSISGSGSPYFTGPLRNDSPNGWKVNEWNPYEAIFVMTSEHKTKSSTFFFIHNVLPGYSYAVDNISIKEVETQELSCDNLVHNGDFATGSVKHWHLNGKNSGMIMIDNAEEYNGTGFSLATVSRSQFYDSMAQNLLSRDCLATDQIYEVDVNYRLDDKDGNGVSCDPFNKYFVESTCPQPMFKLTDNAHRETFKYLGFPIGPYKTGRWNRLNGYFTVTEDIISAAGLEIQLGKAAPGINLVIDNVVVKLADSNTYGIDNNCSQLVTNGDAEIGDARYWYIKGKGDYGTISMVPGSGNSNWAFHHGYNRTRHFNGLWQEIDQGCMAVGSEWKVTAYFKLYNDIGQEVFCDKSKKAGSYVCPMFLFQSHTVGEKPHFTSPLQNKSPGDWVIGDWNFYESVFLMTKKHKKKSSITMNIHNVLAGYSYSVDNISIVAA